MFYRYFVSAYLLILFPIVTIACIAVVALLRVVTGWYDRQLRAVHLFACFWASSYTWLNPLWTVKVTGRHHIAPRKAYVMVSNHQSVTDILVLYRLFRHFKWVAKSSLFRIPVIGWNLRLNRYIRIERGSLTSQRKMIRQCEENLRRGSSVMIFPEGTRSASGQLRSFKEGAFLIAMRQQADILPIAIDGTADILPRHSLLFKRQIIRLHVLPPVASAEYSHLTPQQLTEHIRGIIAAELQRMRGEA